MTDEIDEVRKNAPKTPPGRPFAQGNPGRPKGARHKISLLAEKLMSDDVEGVVQTVVKAAKAGDMTAARLILERISPPRKDAPISIELPNINGLDDVSKAMAVVVKAAANAEIGLSEADALTRLIQGYSASLEMSELAKRVEQLENQVDQK
ncbi:MAG: hypothetical protein EB015_14270 [Methylocystaceae bacterium]|nr:hypothetical protein [Methylocystaceae bacterium]